MPVSITKKWGATALPAAAAVQIGAASIKAPEWAKELMSMRIFSSELLPTATQALRGQAYLSSNDFSCQPSRVVFLANVGQLATNGGISCSELWPLNYPLFGGSAFDLYMDPAVTCTGNAWGMVNYKFGDGEAISPSKDDPYPHLSRFYEVCEQTGTDKLCASAIQALTQLTITGVDPNVGILEIFGYKVAPTYTVTGGIGDMIFSSNAFFTSPLELGIEVLNGTVATPTMAPGMAKVSRANIQLPTSPTTLINCTYQEYSTTAATDAVNAGVCFKRI